MCIYVYNTHTHLSCMVSFQKSKSPRFQLKKLLFPDTHLVTSLLKQQHGAVGACRDPPG